MANRTPDLSLPVCLEGVLRAFARKQSLLAAWTIILALLVQQSAFARISAQPIAAARVSDSRLQEAGSVFIDSKSGLRIVRVTDTRDGQPTPASSGSSFNLDSSHFIVNLDGTPMLYAIDPASLELHKQGMLFGTSAVQADGLHWSAVDASAILGLESADSAIIFSYDTRTGSRTVLKDFSGSLGTGVAHQLSKSATDDNHFAFSWGERGSNPSVVVVWDRAAGSTFVFYLNDPFGGVSGFSEAHLDRTGEALIVIGETTRVWRYRTTTQADSVQIEKTGAGGVEAESQQNDSFDVFASINHPSELPRSDVSPDGRLSIFPAASGGSRSDVFIAAVNINLTASSIIWAHMVNCSAVANSLQKTGGVDLADDARATSTQAALLGDAYVEFTAQQSDRERSCGLNNSNEIHQSTSDINFAIKLTSTKKANVVENGVVKARIKYKAGNVFRVAVESGVVNYYKNGSVFYTSTAPPVFPLLVNASLVNTMASVDNVMMSAARMGAVISISPAKASLIEGATLQFTALVTGGVDTSITWSATGGAITSGGLYTAPNAVGTYTVKVAYTSNPNISASATVMVSSGADVTPPVISSVSSSSITTTSATIAWTTNEASDTQVEYGMTTSYGSSSALNNSLVTSHSAFASGLSASTLYHYRAKSRDAAGNLAVTADFTFTTASAPPPPPDPGGGVITDHNVYPEPAAPALPAAGGTFVDPTFGTTIMRVTDEHDGQSNFNYYSYWPTFNLDDTKFFVACDNSPMLYRFDPAGFRIISKGPLFDQVLPGGGYMSTEDAEWSGTNPNLLYGYYGLKLWAFDVTARTYILIKDFTGLVPAGYLGQMSRSLDDNIFAFTLKDPNYAPTGYMVWQRDQNRIVRNVSLSNFDEVELDKTGRYLVVKALFGGGVDFQVVDLQTGGAQGLTDPAPDYSPGHSDNGRNIVVGYDDWNNQYTVRSLANPHQFQRVISFGSDWSQANHLSMLGDNESWCLISNFTNGTSPVGPFRQEIFQASTDGTQSVRRLAHHHSVYRDYWDTPRADISRSGRFVAFTSNWGSSTRRDVFIIKVPQGSGSGGGGDTTPPVISGVNASSINASGASVSWTTNEASDSQVEYGTSAAYGSATTLNTSMTSSHNPTLSGLAATTVYHYRVRSRDAAGNLAVSEDFTFTTTAGSGGGGGGGGGATENVVWTGAVNCTATGNSLQKTSGLGDTPDAAGTSQQQIASGDGYLEFTAGATGKIRFCGLTHSPSGTDFYAIDFALKLTETGVAEIRENNSYQGETTYTGGDVFRIAIQGGVVKYYKNGAVFYTSGRAPSYPLRADAVFINLNGTVNNAVISAGSGGQ